MRAILLNDTRSDNHIGCELVINNTLAQCEQHGIQVIHTIQTCDAKQAEELIIPFLDEADLIILNGEGTLHDDKSRAIALLKAADLGKKAGLKTALYNALWDNNPIGQQYLPSFDLIYCRDSVSTAEITQLHPNLPVSTVADMIFATPVSKEKSDRTNRPLVSDSVRKNKCFALAKFAVQHRLPFTPMGSGFHDRVRSSYFLKRKLTRHCDYTFDQLDSADAFAQKIQSSSGMITGRFHAACLALLLETPVFCLSSNTRKIEALYTDFGLSPDLVSDSISSLTDAQPQWQEQTRLREQLNEHINETRRQITSMFEKISHL